MQIGDTSSISSETALDKMRAQGQGIWSFLRANPKITFGVGVVVFFVLVAIFAPVLTHYSPSHSSADRYQHPSANHWLGTTSTGQDLFAQLVYGAQISLFIGFGSAIGSLILQIAFGLTAGYFGGLIDDVLSFITNVFLVIPGLPLALVVSSFVPVRGPQVLTLLLLFTSWSYGARVLRAQTLSLKQREFVAAARASGESNFRLIFAEILPNEIALVGSNFVGTCVYTLLAEVAFEFLGLGDVTRSSWGVMLYWAQGNQALLGGAWWWFVPPGLCVAILCTGLTFLNFGIDELANPRLRRDKTPRVPKQAKMPRVSSQAKEVVA